MKTMMKVLMTASVLAMSAGAALAEGTVVAVIGGKADDQFFAKVKKGIDDGALVVQAHGGSVNYLMLQNYDNIGGDAANPCGEWRQCACADRARGRGCVGGRSALRARPDSYRPPHRAG